MTQTSGELSEPLAKTFDPTAIEAKWYAHWEESGAFRPHRPEAEPFTIVNPPPNVTGSLHIGHALDNTLQDVIVRYERLRGKDALWVVGTDHAGIATQMVVERELEQRQDKRTNYSREDFVAKVWEWKEESGGTITRQLRRLGCSMDWSREQFTMDPHFIAAVTKVFVDLYNDGLIYRDKRLVNWDPKLKTAISDLEVETRETAGHFWHFRYPLADGVTTADDKDHLVVATTRPETMLADMAVAVHPSDERYAGVVGKDILQPLTGRRFKVVADEHADPELGSGVVKITPGHDFNDFEVGKRAGMKPGEMLNMFDAEARVVQTADGLVPAEFVGLDRFDARKLVVERLRDAGCLIPHVDKEGAEHDAEPRTIQQPFGDRGGVPIEPWLTDQWYVDAKTLAQAPIQAVKDGRIEIVPKSWEKTFFNWMENIQPWCVSRQLWWGHRIPAWYGPDGTVFVANGEDELGDRVVDHCLANYTADQNVRIRFADSEDEARQLVKGGTKDEIDPEVNGPIYAIWQDSDVLDTWFSSALWPFATLGWPENTPPPPAAVPLPGQAGEDSLSSPSPDGEGDHAQHGGGVRYKLPPKTNAAVMRAKAMRRTMPPSETTLWGALKERPGGFKFRKQHPAGDHVLDFFCPAAGLAIEVDGEAHDRGNRPDRDALRDAFMRDCGVETLRIPARDVFRDLESVVTMIVERVRERIPLHQPAVGPPPRRAGEDSLLSRHYPNDLLISGFDILFFWDARMAMQGMHLMGEVPWKRLYLHGLVRAADGSKMAKSKGNTVDPLGLIDKYGADALRFFMAAMESQGRDVKMDEKRVEGYRNFATKLWNAARFCQANGIGGSQTLAAPPATLAVNKWIIGEVVETTAALDKAFADLRFDAAANAIYHFVWDRFCDWYLELIKPVLSQSSPSSDGEGDHAQHGGGVSSPSSAQNTPPPPAAVPLPGGAGEDQDETRPSTSSGQADLAEETKSVAGWVLDQILVMLHPFMPFITEELWHAQGARAYDLILAQWPEPQAEVDAAAKAEVDWLVDLISKTRAARSELNVPPSARTDLMALTTVYAGISSDDPPPVPHALIDRVDANRSVLTRMARLDRAIFVNTGTEIDLRTGERLDRTRTDVPERSMGPQVVVGGVTYILPVADVIDVAAEKVRLAKALEISRKEARALDGRLSNAAFVEKAKPEAVEKARADHAHHAAEAARLQAALARLG